MTDRIRGAKGTPRKPAAKKSRTRTRRTARSAVLAKITEMAGPDRGPGGAAPRDHQVLRARTSLRGSGTGCPPMPRAAKVLCFFQGGGKFKTRYATLGFMHAANLDDGAMWPVAFALKELTAAAEARVVALVKKAVS